MPKIYVSVYPDMVNVFSFWPFLRSLFQHKIGSYQRCSNQVKHQVLLITETTAVNRRNHIMTTVTHAYTALVKS